MARRRARRGFVLLMTLLLICLVGTFLVGVARSSLDHMAASMDQARQLQFRWGQVTLRRALVQRAGQLYRNSLSQAGDEGETLVSPFPLRRVVSLGDIEFYLRLDDEQTKINLNRLHAQRNKDAILGVIFQHSESPHLVQLRPVVAEDWSFQHLPLASWGQVFNLAELTPGEVFAWSEQNTGELTLWGNGYLNLHYVKPDILKSVVGPEVRPSTLRNLFKLRGQPGATVASVMKQLELTDAERRELIGWLTDSSTTFGVWIEAHDAARYSVELAIVSQQSGRVESFLWW